MEYKSYNLKILTILIFIVTFVSIFNYLIDPFAVFHNENKFNVIRPNIDKNQRISKIPALKLLKENVDAIWIGSSKTGWATNEEYESKILNKNIKNLTLNGCSLEEAINMAKNAIEIHPEIKTIYMGLDFYMFSDKNRKDLTPLNSTKIEKEEIFPLILSFDTFSNSFKTVIKNLKKKKDEKQEYGNEIQYNKKIENKYKITIKKYRTDFFHNFKLSQNKFIELKDFIEFAKEKDVEVVLFITTGHVSERILIDNCNYLSDFYKFKKELSEIKQYYDFAIIDKYTIDEIRPEMQYFRDAVHSSPFLRKKISNTLFSLGGGNKKILAITLLKRILINTF